MALRPVLDVKRNDSDDLYSNSCWMTRDIFVDYLNIHIGLITAGIRIWPLFLTMSNVTGLMSLSWLSSLHGSLVFIGSRVASAIWNGITTRFLFVLSRTATLANAFEIVFNEKFYWSKKNITQYLTYKLRHIKMRILKEVIYYKWLLVKSTL